MALSAPDRTAPLLERAAELDVLTAAARDGGRLVLVAGEAGVGKTALLRRFCREQSARVLWGECDALFTPSPLGPLRDIAAQTGGPLADVVSDAAPPHAVVAALLEELEAGAPTILVLEDVHWADEATLDVLRLLGRRIAGMPATVVASYRDDALDRAHPLRIPLGELSRRAGTARLRLVPLSTDGVAVLAAPHGVDAEALHRRTAGNPFFVTEALAGDGVALPATVRDAVLARVTPLSEPARRVLDGVAIVPGVVEPPLLEALAADPRHLEECLSCGVLGPAGRGVAFRHELARESLEAALPPPLRAALHRQVLAALGADADPARLAYHAEGASDGEAVARFAPVAAERAAAAGAHREAAAQYARALRHADELAPAELAGLLEARAHECYLADRPAEGAAELERALACHRRTGDRRREGDALRSLSAILWCPGTIEEAARTGREAVAVLTPLGDGRELAMAYANMAAQALNLEDAAGAAAWGDRALRLARELGDGGIEIHALDTIGTMEFLARGPDARATAERALALALEAGAVDEVLRAYSNLAWAALRRREYALADAYLDGGTAYAGDRAIDIWTQYLLGYRTRAELERGRWEAAGETAARVVRGRTASPLPVIIALSTIGRLRARRGDPEPWAPLDEAAALTGEELQRLEPVTVARAEAAWLAGDAARVAAETERVLGLARRCGATGVVAELAAWRRRAGVVETVEPVAGPYALELAGRHEQAAASWAALGCRYEAALALAGADDDEALRRALGELHALGAPAAAAIVARRLRERGAAGLPRGPRPATRENPAQLTPRELEVLALVADGLRNKDIAERLFLAPKTVDHHVSAILRKLGARTRGEAAAAARLAQDR